MRCVSGLKTMNPNLKNLLGSKELWFIIVPLLVVFVLTFNTLVWLVVGILLGRWSTILIKRGDNEKH